VNIDSLYYAELAQTTRNPDSVNKIISWIIIILTLPIWLPVILYGVLFQKRKIFFFQTRPGKNEKPFTLIKFRTMTDEIHLPESQRITPLGKFLRKYHLDELPQLINILKGEMNFIGPRPLLMEYLPLYNERQRRRHLVRPGITGWSQVQCGRSASWQERLEADVWYVENRSFRVDCQIIYQTLILLFKRKESLSDAKTFEKFTGNTP
jgi:sugar transferase EpsL